MAKVSLVGCEEYATVKVLDAVGRAVDLVGGIGAYCRPGMRVLVKPNLLSARGPEDAVDTHPEVVRAVCRLVRLAGAVPVIGDSPGGYYKSIENVFEKSGMRKMAAEEGVELVRFTSSKFVDGIPIARRVLDSDRVISVPKLKTHGITVITAAIKNMYGAVTGLYKAECHSRAPKEQDFAKVLAKVYSIAKPHLTVLDAIVAMEGNGPAAGTPRRMNFVMAGSDGVAVDSCAAKIIGLNAADIRVTREAAAMGLGESDPEKIEMCGDDPLRFVAEDFRLPQTTPLKFIPKTIAEGLAAMVRFRPRIDSMICTRCNLCKITCPVDCIEIEKDDCRIDYRRCVRCLCCHEVCPYKAITIKSNILTKMIWG